MPSARVIITAIAAVAALIAFFAARGSYPPGSRSLMAISLGVFIGVYVVGSLVYGMVQGMREARAKRQQPVVPPPSASQPPRRDQ